jgi:enterochelin esterase-like enzyme
MHKTILFLTTLLLSVPLSHSLVAQEQKDFRVTFILRSPDLPDTANVFITGSDENLGMWDPSKVKMQPAGDHTWLTTVILVKKGTYEYKYTKGSWQREGANANGLPLRNFIIKISGDTTIRDQVLFWTTGRAERVNHGQVTGTVKYHRGLTGAGLKERDLVVWLPPGYNKDSGKRYPVLYMQDGQNLFDPVTSAFGIDWSIDETADSLIRNKLIPSLIIVGINNTSDRMNEYLPGEKGESYMDFVVQKVKPFIDSAYRTRPEREYTLTGGSSAGGIISFMLVWEHPDVFTRAICMSPAFKEPEAGFPRWDYSVVVGNTKKPAKDLFFYIDNGGVGLDGLLQPGVDETIAALKRKGFREGRNLYYMNDTSAEHNEAAWAKRFPNALIVIAGTLLPLY